MSDQGLGKSRKIIYYGRQQGKAMLQVISLRDFILNEFKSCGIKDFTIKVVEHEKIEQLERQKAMLIEALGKLIEAHNNQILNPIAFKMKFIHTKEVLSKLGGGGNG